MFDYSLEIRGFEPLTYGLQSRRSSQLSYIPLLQTKNIKKGRERRGDKRKLCVRLTKHLVFTFL